MKRLIITFMLLVLIPSLVFSAPFAPSRLQLTLPSVQQYNFDGSLLEIPVTVTGTPARIWFFVFTKDKGEEIGEVQNGYLGWHYVNRIDTCMFTSAPNDLQVGQSTINWDGKDDDGGTVPPGDYTYYAFAYDYTTPPESQVAVPHDIRFQKEDSILVKELGEDGAVLDNPYLTTIDGVGIVHKWILGGDPTDTGLLETCDLQIPENFRYQIPRPTSPSYYDPSLIYFCESNKDDLIISLRRATWVPNDLATRDTEWGFQSNECFRNVTGPFDDGNYLYWGKSDVYSTEPCTNSYVSDYDGGFVAQFQNDFWIKPEEFARGATQLQGGPRWNTSPDGSGIIVQSTYFVLNALGNPLRYLDSYAYPDFTNCFNQNGDYVLDRAYYPEHPTPWLNFSESAPYTRECYADHNFFAVAPCSGLSTSFALLAPDYTGVGYFNYAGEPGTTSRATAIVQNGSAYDGMYVAGLIDSEVGGLGYCAHDSFKGLLQYVVGVADAAPSAFAVEQNSPNPANPATTISFTLPEAGSVTVDVFNVAGQKVDTLANDFMESGRHSVVWDGSKFSTGVYFYTVTSGDFSRTMKMTLLK